MTRQRFQAIYVESRAAGYKLTSQIIARLPQCPVIPIRHYKDVFNRSNQDIRWQKDYPCLILAVKDAPFVYTGSRICQHFGHDRFFYSNLMLGCPFDCSYCYLQGLYPSANQVIFVNLQDFTAAFSELGRDPVYLALSHDADMLASHSFAPLLDDLAGTLDAKLPLLAEIRTKSAVRDYFLKHDPFPLFIFAFTLAPDSVIDRYERKTPPLAARLATVKAALSRGHAVRLCFDPILIDPQVDEAYLPFFRDLFQEIDPAEIVDVSYGFFRMSSQFYQRIARIRPTNLLNQEIACGQEPFVTYAAEKREAISRQHLALLHNLLGPERVFLD